MFYFESGRLTKGKAVKYEIPKKANSDAAYSATKAISNLIPLVGGTVTEIFCSIVNSPIEKRRNEWIQEVVDTLEKLEAQRNGIVQELANNEEFISLLIAASVHAFKTHLIDKRNKLKAALINSIDANLSYDVKQIYLNFIDELTLTHIELLKFVYQREARLHNVNQYHKIYGIMLATNNYNSNHGLLI